MMSCSLESVVKIVLDAAATQRGFHFADIPEVVFSCP